MSTAITHPQFAATHLVVSRRKKRILNKLTLALQAGEVLSLLGANGAGKSTFLSALAGELNPSDADNSLAHQAMITLNKQPLPSMTSLQQARVRSVLPQKSGLAFDFEVSEVVAMGAYPYPELEPHTLDELCAEALVLAEVTELRHRRYLELSGGEQQRVHYARAVLQVLSGIHHAHDQCYFLLDEPTSSLDPLHQHRLLCSVRKLARAHRLGILVILHDVNLAAQFSDRIALLSQGQILACDTPAKVLTVDNLREVYGMEAHIMPHPKTPYAPLVVFG